MTRPPNPVSLRLAFTLLLIGALGLASADGACQQRPPGELPDDQLAALTEKAIGTRPTIVRYGRIRIVTTLDEHEARKQLTLAEATYAKFNELVGDPPGTCYGGTMTEFLITREQCPAFLATVLPRCTTITSLSALDRATALRDGSFPTPPVGFSGLDRERPHYRVVNHVVDNLLANYYSSPPRRPGPPGFLRLGLVHEMNARYCGEFRGVVVPAAGWSLAVIPPRKTAAWQRRVERLVAHGTHEPLEKLQYFFATDFEEDAHAMSWSLVRFLMKEHATRFGRMLRRQRTERWARALEAEFGWSLADLEKRWKAWVTSGGKKTLGSNDDRQPHDLSDRDLIQFVRDITWEEPAFARSTHFRLLAPARCADSVSKWADLLERVQADFARLVGDEPDTRYWPGWAGVFAMQNRGQFLAMQDSGVTDREANAGLHKHASLRVACSPPVALFVTARTENSLVYIAARLLLHHGTYNRKTIPPWIMHGFTSAAEARYTGEARVLFQGAVCCYCNRPETEFREEFRALPRQIVAQKTYRPLAELRRLPHAKFALADLAQAHSLFRFFHAEHRAALGAWLRLARTRPWDKALHEAFGWTDREATDRWAEWVGRRADAEKSAVPVGPKPAGK